MSQLQELFDFTSFAVRFCKPCLPSYCRYVYKAVEKIKVALISLLAYASAARHDPKHKLPHMSINSDCSQWIMTSNPPALFSFIFEIANPQVSAKKTCSETWTSCALASETGCGP